MCILTSATETINLTASSVVAQIKLLFSFSLMLILQEWQIFNTDEVIMHNDFIHAGQFQLHNSNFLKIV